jgi:hypothetical protein
MNITLTDEQVQDIIDTALYGGIQYWAWVEGVDDSLDPVVVKIQETAAVDLDSEDVAPVHFITEDVIRRGFELYPKHLINQTTIVGSLHIFEAGETGDSEIDLDIDAGAADLIVQFGLFGEERYA